MFTRAHGLIVRTCAESPASKTPGDSGTPEHPTSHSCESSRAPQQICPREKSLPESDGTPKLSCRPCLSHVRQEPQITQEFQRLLSLPPSKRVDQKEDGTHNHHVRHSATRGSQSRPMSQPRSLHLQVIHAPVCAMRTARGPRLRFVPHRKLRPTVRAAVSALSTAGTTAGGWTAISSSTDLAASQRAPRRHHRHRPSVGAI